MKTIVKSHNIYIDSLASDALEKRIIVIVKGVYDIDVLPKLGDTFVLSSREFMLASDGTTTAKLVLTRSK